MKAKYSKKDSRGMAFIDCAECQKGKNGNSECSAAKSKKGNKGGCFMGILIEDLEI